MREYYTNNIEWVTFIFGLLLCMTLMEISFKKIFILFFRIPEDFPEEEGTEDVVNLKRRYVIHNTKNICTNLVLTKYFHMN